MAAERGFLDPLPVQNIEADSRRGAVGPEVGASIGPSAPLFAEGEVMKEFFATEHDVVEGLKKVEAALALAYEFLARVTKDGVGEGTGDDVWELNQEAFTGLAHILFETRWAVRDIAQEVMEQVVEAKVKEFTGRQLKSVQSRGRTAATAQS